MTADEQQPQHIVAIMRPVQPFGQRRFDIVQIGDGIVIRQRHIAHLLAHAIQRRIAPHQNQPGGGIARRPVLGPVLQRPQRRFLKGLLGAVEIAEIAQQRADRLGTGGSQRGIDPGQIIHVLTVTP